MAETFGRTVKGDTEQVSMTPGYIYPCLYESGSAGDLTSISFYVKQNSTDTPRVKCAIYNADKSALANGTTEEHTVGAAQDGWMVFNFVGTKPTVLAATSYYLCPWWGDSALNKFYSAGTTDQTGRDTQTYDGWPDPLFWVVNYDQEQSIFATYEEAPPAKKTLVQAALISIPPLIVLPTLGQILRFAGGY